MSLLPDDDPAVAPASGGVLQFRRLLWAARVLTRLRVPDQHRLFIWAPIVGIGGALAAQAFKLATNGLQWVLTQRVGGYVETFRELSTTQRILVPTIGGLLAGLVMLLGQRMVRRQATDYMEAVALGDGDIPVRASLVKSASALCSIASGAAIGREGPLVQLAALAAAQIGKLRRLAPARQRLIVACGAAAGLASAYHAPLGGALFVAEIVVGSIAMESFGPLLLASVAATLTTQSFEGVEPIYAYSGFAVQGVWEIAWFAALGLLCGVAAHLWMMALRHGKRLFGQLPGPAWSRLALGGLIIGLLAAWHPEVTGNGGSVIRTLLATDFGADAVAVLLLVKIAATLAAFGSGAVGGVFTPTMFVGAMTGWLFAWLAGWVAPDLGLSTLDFALIGMGSFLAAAARAPVMAIVMLFEMTLSYALMLPLIVGTVIAYVVVRSIGSDSLYGESLRAGPRSIFDRGLSGVTVGDIMRKSANRLTTTASFGAIAREFLRSGASEMWVTDEDRRWRGAILLHDVSPFLKEPLLAETVLAGDIVREDLSKLPPGLHLAEALALFSRSPHERLPVVDDRGFFLGTVGRADVYLTISELTRRASTAANA